MPDLADTPTTAFSPAMPVRGSVPGNAESAQPSPEGWDAPTTFSLYRHGEVTVIGWDGAEEIDADPEAFLREAADVVAGADAKALAIDLTGLERYPPGMLGGLPSLVRRDVRVLLFNPTEDVRGILEASRLDQLLGVHTADLED
ncbi:hypothetical protein [Alienimonas chondri]|uniref:STAS domain-containing protein n=1 Tax=Alienimonas chondri TaxID=2681879 RepID=A0ABX1VCX3_9PLAN|nr:hypothetical protein [Alienimonas chondri]NNJ25904.1 hypothetical protein [Alienimonas chondri]